ncbi:MULTISPECIES: Na+/H+ antiporter subunit E [unclassified Rubrivivax]|uniref:Na+/H+ antiporter subunit E n=1 Tax=unclassified Rubrivivax TaxID=2649762 RepID=UPI001E3D0C70|nr:MULTISPECIES: Na+/H+ antiporter subunit E [unclassified Rubrivivax]MCC9595227.1 Na+/H+ antiporter subunit E [Rubrivivax sp. JA1055]MCC9647980.1 Na+/H+ antiporter subunit E [Rubrivivax sp. JA1029]
MKRLLPAPLLSAGLFAMWLLLRPSLSTGSLLLGALLALVLPVLMAPLRPAGGPVRRPLVVMRLVAIVGVDVVLSALDVARGVLSSRRRPPRGTFVVVPLDLRDVHGLAALAMITTVVPGTVWCELAPDRSALRLHVFDLVGEAEFVAHFKQRYEQPLKEIFG